MTEEQRLAGERILQELEESREPIGDIKINMEEKLPEYENSNIDFSSEEEYNPMKKYDNMMTMYQENKNDYSSESEKNKEDEQDKNQEENEIEELHYQEEINSIDPQEKNSKTLIKKFKINNIKKVEVDPIQDAIEIINKMFSLLDRINNSQELMKCTTTTINTFERELGAESKFYEKKYEEKRKQIAIRIMQGLEFTGEDLKTIITMEASSPISIMAFFLKIDLPDILITNRKIKLQHGTRFKDIEVPKHLRKIFLYFFDHFIRNQTFMNVKKFDILNAIMDSAFEKYRFNFIHRSLTTSSSDIVAIRKHIQNVKPASSNTEEDIERYEGSLGCPIDIIKKIKERAITENIIIFGETSSGKTTFLRDVINYKLDSKRNVITIEDTPELFIDTMLPLITNGNFTIHDLFVSAMRENPSTIVIGETRTEEIVDILESALASNVATTIHAKGLQQAAERIYFMSRPRGLSREDIESLTTSTISIFVFMKNKKIHGVWRRNFNHYGREHDFIDCYSEIYTSEEYKQSINFDGGM